MPNFFASNRDRMGLTQAQVAAALRITTQRLSSWERGLSGPRPELWPHIAKLFDTDISAVAEAVSAIAKRRRRSVKVA